MKIKSFFYINFLGKKDWSQDFKNSSEKVYNIFCWTKASLWNLYFVRKVYIFFKKLRKMYVRQYAEVSEMYRYFVWSFLWNLLLWYIFSDSLVLLLLFPKFGFDLVLFIMFCSFFYSSGAVKKRTKHLFGV